MKDKLNVLELENKIFEVIQNNLNDGLSYESDESVIEINKVRRKCPVYNILIDPDDVNKKSRTMASIVFKVRFYRYINKFPDILFSKYKYILELDCKRQNMFQDFNHKFISNNSNFSKFKTLYGNIEISTPNSIIKKDNIKIDNYIQLLDTCVSTSNRRDSKIEKILNKNTNE